jgi:hypothetical protein
MQTRNWRTFPKSIGPHIPYLLHFLNFFWRPGIQPNALCSRYVCAQISVESEATVTNENPQSHRSKPCETPAAVSTSIIARLLGQTCKHGKVLLLQLRITFPSSVSCHHGPVTLSPALYSYPGLAPA